jgi:hypothetical protein
MHRSLQLALSLPSGEVLWLAALQESVYSIHFSLAGIRKLRRYLPVITIEALEIAERSGHWVCLPVWQAPCCTQRQTRMENQENLANRGFYWETRNVYEPSWWGIHNVHYFYLFPPKSD